MTTSRGGRAAAIALAWCASLSHAAVNNWTPLGPDGGRVIKLQFSSASQTLFAAASNGVYRSQDGAQHWQLMYDQFLNGPSDLVVDPTDASHVYVTAPAAPGLYVSIDGGTTFTPSSSFPTAQQGGHLAISADGKTLCVAAVDAHVFCSTDRAQTWSLRGQVTTYSSALALNLLMVPTNPNTMYVACTTSATSDDILVTHDGGVTWASLRSVIPATGYVLQITLNPSLPTQLWAAANDGAWVSNDAGATWFNKISDAVSAIAVDPANASTVYAGSPYGTVSRSADGGSTWADVTGNIGRQQIGTVAVDPTLATHLVVGGITGIAASTQSGNQWTTLQSGLNATMVNGLAADATAGGIYISVGTNGLFFTPGSTDFAVPINDNAGLLSGSGAGPTLSVSAMTAGSGVLWASNTPWLYKSTDGGNSWAASQFRSVGPNQFLSMAIAAGSPSIVLGAADTGLYRTADGGTTWDSVTAGIPTGSTLTRVLTAPSDSNYAYASVDLEPGGPGAPTPLGIFRSQDGGLTWAAAASNSAVAPQILLAIDPTNAEIIYGNTSSILEKSSDGGVTWSSLPWSAGGDGGVLSMAVNPIHPQELWVSGAVRIARSVDGGTTWETIHDVNSLPAWSSSAMLVDAGNPSTVLLGTSKAGLQAFTAAPDLAISASAPADPVPVGVAASYGYSVSNLGPFDASGVQFSVSLPAGSPSVSASSGGTTCSVAGTAARCSLGILRTNAHASITVTVTPSVVGPLMASATVSGDQSDPSLANNSVTTTSTVAVVADVSVTATGPATAVVGGAVSYTLTASNAGPSVVPSTQLTYQLASGLTPVAVSASGANCSTGSGGLITCAIANLPVGKSVSVAVSATAATAGSQSSTAHIDGSGSDPSSSNNAATVTTVVSTPASSGGSSGGSSSGGSSSSSSSSSSGGSSSSGSSSSGSDGSSSSSSGGASKSGGGGSLDWVVLVVLAMLVQMRRWCMGVSLAFLLPVWTIEAVAGQEARTPCPGAEAWKAEHANQLSAALTTRDAARSFSAPELRAELERRVEADQHARKRLLTSPQDLEARNSVLRMDEENLAWLKKLVNENGIPTVAQVGENGVHWTWLLVQHADADPRFQMSVQPIFAQRQAAGELPADDLARLTDRVLLAGGKPQRFGTQFDWFSGKFQPKGSVNLADIDANRQAIGLMPLVDYACMMNDRLKRD